MNLAPLFNPKTVAIIGATDKKEKLGNVVMGSFIREFKGKTVPVNPKLKTVLGLKCYASVKDYPGAIDTAVICVPAPVVVKVMKECVQKKVKGAIIITSGFAEAGRLDLEEELRKVAKNIPIIGVNCMGILDPHNHIDTLFYPPYKLSRPKPGGIGFISQSGALGSAILDWASDRGFGISKFISYGNATNVDEVDLLNYLGNDKKTKVICLYVENTRRGRELVETCKRVARKKPIIAIKGGRTAGGARAAGSHTGALVGDNIVWNAALKQGNVICAGSIAEMFDIGRVLENQPRTKGKRVAIVTNGGGLGVIAADECVEAGLELAKISKKTEKRLRQVVPYYVSLDNPVDLAGDADVARYRKAFEALWNDDNVDMVLCILLFQTSAMSPGIVELVCEYGKNKKKPLVVVSIGGEYTTMHLKKIEQGGAPTFESTHTAARALAAIAKH